jgi:hypothetical protein
MGFCVAERPMRGQALERHRQMRAALVVRHGVNLIHDDGVDGSENLAALLRRQQNEERLGRRD